ncbi:MAG: hypothetical protein P8182_14870 [Deltaproteobacteria bacterium]
MKPPATLFVLFVLLAAFSTDPARAQQTSAATASSSASAISSAPSPYAIGQNFISIEQAGLTRKARQLERCIRNAQENLVDIQGNINRVAQTDLLVCGRELQIVLRKQQKLVRTSSRMAAEAQIQYQILSQLLRKVSSFRNITSAQYRIPGYSIP